MSGYADELLDDLASDEEQQQPAQSQVNGSSAPPVNAGTKRSYHDDLDDLSDGDDGEENQEQQVDTLTAKQPSNGVRPAEELDSADVQSMDLASISSVSAISSLLSSSKLQTTMAKITEFESKAASSSSSGDEQTAQRMQIEGVLEHSEEYQLIVRANNLAVEVDNEILLVHKFIRDHYSPRFPELADLIPNAWQYVQAVEALGNEDTLTSGKHSDLESLLPHGTVVVISMTASHTTGKRLPDAEWQRVIEGCRVVKSLDEHRTHILSYVESRISFIAPNLSSLVGSRVATKLLAVAGGLTALSKIPACNIQVLGAARKNQLGGSGVHAATERHVGFVGQADLVAQCPPDVARQAIRLVSAKVALVARMDANHSSPLGTYGSQLKRDLEAKVEKLLEPPPTKLTKALPVPKEGGDKKRRGGRRARKMKELYGASELRKAANRVEFGVAEEEAGAFDETVGLGMAGGNTGKIRATAGEAKTKAKMSRKNQLRLQALSGGQGRSGAASLDAMSGGSGQASGLASSSSAYGGAGAGGGTQTSIAFTPVQGIELADPSARQRKADEANARWFASGTFSTAPGVASTTGKGSMGPPAPKK
ncbi:Nop domain-containing protein [Jaminaea rosea]|uniref:Nop domain-containing protein n=1 Tax=Jaminaea rosea TaxID=1569628 RepID=A0A316UGT6_9BASI|nr:Nop domain-containing protein [Jaminaea rosea]PWN24472.1 Nop domain-containing protein [Jaminaea rosea]